MTDVKWTITEEGQKLLDMDPNTQWFCYKCCIAVDNGLICTKCGSSEPEKVDSRPIMGLPISPDYMYDKYGRNIGWRRR